MKTLGNDVTTLNDTKFPTIKEKMLAMKKLSATYMELEGSEKQISYANSLVEREFGENLTKLDSLIEKCEKFKAMPNFPLHKQLERQLKLWNEVKDEKNAATIIEKLKSY